MRHWRKKPWVDSNVRNWDYVAKHLLPEVSSEEYGKTLIVSEDGEWVLGDVSGGGGDPTLTSISAVYTQSGTVYDTDSLDSLKADLVVTATYDDSSTETVTTYTLSGTLAVGTSTITVSYGGKTTTFNVTVTHATSDMNGWHNGVTYTNLEIVNNEYVKAADGSLISYNGWNRTGYVPCDGASTITFSALPQTGSQRAMSNWFYDANHNPVSGGENGFILNKDASTVITVPATAAYFIISSNASALTSCINDGIIPYA